MVDGRREGGRRRERPPPNSDSDGGGGFGLQSSPSPFLLPPPPTGSRCVQFQPFGYCSIRAKNRLGWMRRRREGGPFFPPWDTPAAAEVALQYFYKKQAWTRDIVQGAEMCKPLTLGEKYEGSKYLVPPTKKLF